MLLTNSRDGCSTGEPQEFARIKGNCCAGERLVAPDPQQNSVPDHSSSPPSLEGLDGDLNDSPDQSIAQKSPPGTYSEKTNRILAWVQLLRSIAPVIWALVVLVVIVPLIGQIFIHQAFSSAQLKSNLSKSPVQTVVVQPGIDWTTVNGAIAQSLQTAHESAEAYASAELDQWVGELMDRVDQSFLDWYFSYFNQKTVEFKGVFVQLTAGVANLINPDWPSASERVAETLTRDFQSEFAKRVLKPQIAQLKLERLTQATVQQYLSELSASLTAVPVTYQIPQADWDRYLNDIAISIRDTEGNISTLSLKVLMGGGAYLAVKPLVAPLMLKVGSNMVAKFAGKAGAKIAVKTGASLAGKVAAGLLDSAVGVGILIWDVWDTHHTATLEKPILRQTLLDYLEQVKASILDNPETGIMGAINQIEHRIVDSLNAPELAIKPDEIWD